MLIIYLFKRFLFRLKEFIRNWYIVSFFFYTHAVVSFLEWLDRFFALRITIRFLFKPLYGDHGVVGYILGFIFRFLRIIFASFIYLIVILLAIAIYLSWLAIPILIIYKIIGFDIVVKMFK